MRIIEMLLGRRHAEPAPPAAVLPDAPALVTERDRAELDRARARLEPKWAAIDELVADFRAGDGHLRAPSG